MIEVRLFAGLRQGRQKIYQMEPDSVKNVQDIMDVLNIQRSEVNILLINGFHQKPETEVKDADIVCRTADKVGAPIPLTNMVRELFKLAVHKYPPTDDSLEVVRLYEEMCAE